MQLTDKDNFPGHILFQPPLAGIFAVAGPALIKEGVSTAGKQGRV
jgi:hypothetical protein